MISRIRRVPALVALAVLLMPPFAAGQDQPPDTAQQSGGLTLEQLMTVDVQRVFGASRFQQAVTEAPASVSIVTSEEIDRFGYRTLADVLRSVGGFYVSNDRNYSYLGVRGFSRPGDYNTRVLLLIDGHRLNDNIYDQAPLGTEFPLDVELIDRIEVVRGPSSSLYGTSAFFGVINVITKRAHDVGRAAVSAEGGSLATGRLRGSAARSFSDDSEVIFSATGYHSDGESQIFYPALASTTPTHGLATGLDHDEFWQVFGSASRRGWKAQGLWSARTKGIPTGAFGTSINDDRSRTRDARGYVDLSYDAAWRGTTVSWRGAYDQYDYDGTYAAQVEEGLDPDPQADYGRGAWWSTEATVRRRAASSHLVTAGVEVRDNVRQDQGTYYTSSGGVLLDDRRSSTVFGLYAQDEYRVSRRVLLNVGVRYDNLQGEIGATSPRAALILRPLDRASLKVLYGQAFRAPNVYELFYAGPGESRTLTPERIRSSEIIWEQYVGGRLKISASGFFDRIRDLITQIDTDTVIGVDFANLESAQTAGVALEGEMALPRGMHASATYTYADARRPLTGERLSNSPANLGHAAFASPVGRTRLFIGVDGMFIGARQALSGATVDGAAVWNVTLTDRHGPGGTSIGFDVRNLFNTAYGDPGSAEHVQDVLPQLGRTAGVRVAWRF